MPVTPADFLLGVVFPALVAGLLLLRLRRASLGPGAGAALVIGGAYVAAHVLQRGWRGFPPAESTDWAWVAAAGGLAVGALGVTRRGPGVLRLVLRVAVALVLLGLVLAAWRRSAEPTEGTAGLAVAAVAAALLWTLGERPRAAASWFTPAVLALAAGGAAGAIGASGSLKLALLAGALCAVLTAAAVASALRLAPVALEGAGAPWALVLATLVACAAAYSYLPRSAAGLIALSPCLALLPADRLGWRARGAWLAGLLLLAAAPLALAVQLAVEASPSWDL